MAKTVLWGIRWRDEAISLLTASDRKQARDRAADPARSGVDGWPRNAIPKLQDIQPVRDFEMRVGPRNDLNAPLFYCLDGFSGELAWSRPGSPLLWPESEFRPVHPASHAGLLWGFVWQGRELLIFAAGSVEEACRRVVESGPRWGIAAPVEPALVEADLELVERLELHLSPPDRDSAPTCYRMWIEGCKVGWPPPRMDEDLPLPEDVRMPVRRVPRVGARTRRRRRATGRARPGPSATDS